LAALLLVAGCGSSGAENTNSSSSLTGVEIERAASRNHTQASVAYSGKKPPSGGDHYPLPLTCGAYSEQPPDELAVHSLEHGAVWIAYSPDLDSASVQQLRAFAKQPKVIVSPYAGLDSTIVLVAWEHRLELQSADDARLQQFIDAFGNGKVAPESSAACFGLGTPDAA
jgi:hypothetical protein